MPSHRQVNGTSGSTYVQNRRRHRNGRMNGVDSHTINGVSSAIEINARHDRSETSKSAIGWRAAAAAWSTARASCGARWWKPLKIVRRPANAGGTLRASTDEGSNLISPPERAAIAPNAATFG